MTKLGSPYQDVVSIVASALHPEATVSVGEWVVSPDGDREIDVSVKGTNDFGGHFLLIECKDWRRPVGIGAIDALDSKRKDVGASDTMLFSNSGFTKDALAKARRVGILAASALIADDKRIRLMLERLLVAPLRSVRRASMRVYPIPDHEDRVLNGFEWRDLRYQDLPVINWAVEESARILRNVDRSGVVAAHYAFSEPTAFTLGNQAFDLKGLSLLLECTHRLVAQKARVDVTAGFYDHIRRQVVVPPDQGYMLGPLDNDKWEAYEGPVPIVDQTPGTFDLSMTLYEPLAGKTTEMIPDLDALVSERELKAVENITLAEVAPL